MKKIEKVYTVVMFAFIGALISINMLSCSPKKSPSAAHWVDSIENPDNEEFVSEVAFNEGIEFYDVTQKMFNERYKNDKRK